MVAIETDTIHLNTIRLIGRGNEYDVFGSVITQDGMHRVVKVPARRWYNRKPIPTREVAENELGLVRSYFDKPKQYSVLADTRFSGQGSNFLVLQEEISEAKFIGRRDLRNRNTRDQLQKILISNNRMRQETGRSIGILGRTGALSLLEFSPKITNLLINNDPQPRVRVTDFALLDVRKFRDRLSLFGNNVVLRTFFGLSLSGKNVWSPFAPRARKNP